MTTEFKHLGVTSEDGCCQQVTLASSGNLLDSNVSKHLNLSKDGSRSREICVDHKDQSGRTLFSESDTEDVDIENQFYCSEDFSDETECMWLSSDSKSASFLSSGGLQLPDVDLSDFSLNDRFSTPLAVSGCRGAFFNRGRMFSLFDGYRTDQTEEASVVLDRTQEDVGKDLKDKDLKAEEITCLGSSFGKKIKDSPTGYSESSGSTYERSFCEDSSIIDGSWTSLSAQDEPSPNDQHFDRMDIWISSLDLEGEDSEWVSDTVQGFDSLEYDFPSPSFNSQQNLQIRSSASSFRLPSEKSLDAKTASGSSISSLDMSPEQLLAIKSPPGEPDADEPLFWPFEQNSYWCPEFEGNYLCISPRESGLNIRPPVGLNGSKPVRFRLHQRNDTSLRRKNVQGYRGRILFSSKSTQLAEVDYKTRDPSSHVLKIGRAPSR